MLKILFAVLLAANALLLAANLGFLEAPFHGTREPARMGRQLNAERIVLQGQRPGAAPTPPVAPPPPPAPAAPVAVPAAPAAEPSPAPEPVPAPPPRLAPAAPVAQGAPATADPAAAACVEIGNFGQGDAARFQARLAALPAGAKVGQRNVPEAANYMVLIPSRGSKEGADAAVAQLRQLGITDYFVIQDNSPRQWGVSLGLFRSPEAANAHLAAVTLKGVPGAHVAELARVAFQLRGLDRQGRSGVTALMADFPRQEMRRCD